MIYFVIYVWHEYIFEEKNRLKKLDRKEETDQIETVFHLMATFQDMSFDV